MSGKERRLAAIMFTDIAGYTKMAQAKEALALELLDEHRALLRPLFAAHGGTEVKTIGDAFLVEFRSALEAVLCGAEIQRRMSDRNDACAEERRLLLRIGIHLGDVVHDQGDVYGDAVNVASRIEPLADPGGVCISQQVYDNIRNKTDLEFESIGRIELKNVELPTGVYKINLGPGKLTLGEGTAPRERLAVLPFVNISPDPNDEYFADGLTEELISKLSEIKGLKVIARTSVMNYKKKEKSISQIGRELDAGSIIEGSVRKAGNKIRVAVQLIDSKTEEHLWASNYDKELDDIFAIQSDVAAKVASSVSSGLFPPPKKADTGDVEAYTLYIKGVQRFHEGTEPSLREAVLLFEKAVARDASFARAHAGLCLAWARIAVNGYDDYGVVESRAEPAGKRAVELDPGLAEGHAALASVANILDRTDQVVSEAGEAVRLNPNLAEAHLALGIYHASKGRLQEAIPAMEKAHELDPLSLHTADILARTLRVANENARSLAIMEKMDRLSPMNPKVMSSLAESYMVEEKFDVAQEYLTKGLQLNPTEPLLRLNQGLLYAVTNRKEQATDSMRELMTDKSEAVRTYGELFISAALGDNDRAFRALGRAADMHSWPYLIATLPVFAELRKDRRYREFAARFGLP